MSPHKKIYLDYFGYTEGDFIPCEVCKAPAVDIHAIEGDKMGGRPSKVTHRIENLMALCRKHHEDYGQKKQWKEWLQKLHDIKLNEVPLPY